MSKSTTLIASIAFCIDIAVGLSAAFAQSDVTLDVTDIETMEFVTPDGTKAGEIAIEADGDLLINFTEGITKGSALFVFNQTLSATRYLEFTLSAAIGTTVELHLLEDSPRENWKIHETVTSLTEDRQSIHVPFDDLILWGSPANEAVDLGKIRVFKLVIETVPTGFLGVSSDLARRVRIADLTISSESTKIVSAVTAPAVEVSVDAKTPLDPLSRPWAGNTDFAPHFNILYEDLGIRWSRRSAFSINDWEIVRDMIRGVGDYDFTRIDKLYGSLPNDVEIMPWIPSIPFFLWQVKDPDIVISGQIDRPKYAFMPPSDYAAWRQVVKDFVKYHLDQGYPITGFSVLNEPNNKAFWAGTPQEALRFYAETAKAIKSVDPELKVAGLSFAGGLHPVTMGQFIEYCAKNDVPLDGLTWHRYLSGTSGDVFLSEARVARRLLALHSEFEKTELFVNEWGYGLPRPFQERGSRPIAAAALADAFKAMEVGGIKGSMYFKTVAQDNSRAYWGSGLFDPNGITARPTIYAFEFFNRLGSRRVDTNISEFSEWLGFDAMATVDANDGAQVAIWWHVPGTGAEQLTKDVSVSISLPRSGLHEYRIYRIDSANHNPNFGEGYEPASPVASGFVKGPDAQLTLAQELYGVTLITLAPVKAELGNESLLPIDSRQTYARWTYFRPADGADVEVNPPRISWPYFRDVVVDLPRQADQRFVLELSRSPGFDQAQVRVQDLEMNFYSWLPPLEAGRWYWRVGYTGDAGLTHWSAVRQFDINAETPVWDRHNIDSAVAQAVGHPRLLFDASSLPEIRELSNAHAQSAKFLEALTKVADSMLESRLFQSFPSHDCPPGSDPAAPGCQTDTDGWFSVVRKLAIMAFVHQITQDPKYEGVVSRFLTVAGFAPGGFTSPKSLNPENRKWGAHVAQYLAYFYDWYYTELSTDQRNVVLDSLEWRIDEAVNNLTLFETGRNGMRQINYLTLPAVGWSHEFQTLYPTLVAALAIHDDSPIAREALFNGLNYLIAVANPYGEDEAWNEGPGYGNSKMRYFLDALVPLTIALPDLSLEMHPALTSWSDFFRHITPVGSEHSAFGNRSHNEWDWTSTRVENMYRVAFLSQDAGAMANFEATVARREQEGWEPDYFSMLDSYVLPAYFPEPEPEQAPDNHRLFANEGWITMGAADPSDREGQGKTVSISLQARPRGAYGHSFGADNAFDLHAFGETVSVGGGTTTNGHGFPRHSMSHNTVLVGGHGQVHSSTADYNQLRDHGASLDLERPVRARVIAYQQGVTQEGIEYTYAATEASGAYPEAASLGSFIRHWVFVDNAYLVLYDELEQRPNAEPAAHQWLYHLPPDTQGEVTFDPSTFRFEYRVNDVEVAVQHFGDIDKLRFYNLFGERGQVNVAKCGLDPAQCEEDFRDEPALPANHIWITNDTPQSRATFLSVITPWPAGTPVPVIRALGDSLGVSVTSGQIETSVAFEAGTKADIVIDTHHVGRGGILESDALTGLWFDARLPGEGWFINQTTVGFTAYYFGFDAAGQPLWLLSDTFPGDVRGGWPQQLTMYSFAGGTFARPAPPETSIETWGRATFWFQDCENGRVLLTGEHGSKDVRLDRLAFTAGLRCDAGGALEPAGEFTGLWYDPSLDGEGYTLAVNRTSAILLYYGYDGNGDRLWLISDAFDARPENGTETKFDLLQNENGRFDRPVENLSLWGKGRIQWDNPRNATIALDGKDGKKTATLVKIDGPTAH